MEIMNKGKVAFEGRYRTYFADDTAYADFIDMLCVPVRPVLRYMKQDEERIRSLWESAGISWQTLDWYPQALLWPDGLSSGDRVPGITEHLLYPMNASSLVPVVALDVRGDMQVLDACAAPGGKTLALAEMIGPLGHLVSNDLSADRVGILRQVLSDFGMEWVETSQLPAETIYKDLPEVFDRVLVDAPCSSEQHVYCDAARLATWSSRRIKQLRNRQYRMVDTLVRTLKPGGRLVYSTCAVTPEENEAVVGRILKNRGMSVRLVDVDWGELPGEPGWAGTYATSFDLASVRRIMPDGKLLGAMFVAAFEKG